MIEADGRLRYEPALDGLRALAVLAVILYHDAYSWAKGGFLGVDAFFVLSGFLITSLLVIEYQRAKHIELIAFWGRRLRRLLPALLLLLLFVAVYGWLAVPNYELGRLRWDGLAGLFYVANWRFIASGSSYFDLFTSPSPVRHLWSLAIEEQFYLVWPLVTLGCLRLAKGRLYVLAGVCVVGTAASVWIMDVLWNEGDPSRAYYGTDARAHTILIGCLLALALFVWKPQTRTARIALQVAGVCGALTMLWSWHAVEDISSTYYGLGSLAYSVAVAAVIAAAVQPGRGLIRSPLAITPLVWIGMISYGLYLWHWPVNQWLVERRVGFGGSQLNALRLLVTFAAAIASYYLVERPVREGRWSVVRKRWLVAPVGIALVVVTLFATTADAKTKPTYLAIPASPCPEPSREELAAARRAYRADPLPQRDGVRLKIAVVGDSIACSLDPGFRAVGPSQRYRSQDFSIIGCGVVSGELAGKGDSIPRLTDRCARYAMEARNLIQKDDPDVIVWMSIWEKNDLRVDGRTVFAGTPEHDQIISSRMEAAYKTLTRKGARLVLVAAAPSSQGEFMHIRNGPAGDVSGEFNRLSGLLRGFAVGHPDVTFVDLAELVCPQGSPCPREVAGFIPRPLDGNHFSSRGSVWVVKSLNPVMISAGEASVADGRDL